MDIVDLPFTTEYAKSGRAGCKKCKTNIEKDELRLGAMVQSAFHDGKQALWHHERCFFTKFRPTTEGDIANFEKLRYEDQQRIKTQISNLGPASVVEPSKGKGKKRSAAEQNALDDYGIEYSPNGRAGCRGCELKVLKEEVRVKKVVHDSEIAMKFGNGQATYYHLECFAKLRAECGYFEKGESLPGFRKLQKTDQAKVKELLPAVKGGDIPVKKMKAEPKDEVDAIKEEADEKLIAQQQKAYYKIHDNIKKLSVKKYTLHEILEHNKQKIPEGFDECLNRVSDILTFGALEPCVKCKGQYVFQKSAYICEGDLTEWTKCMDSQPKPKRFPCKVPKHIKEEIPFLGKYKSVVSDRVIKYVPPSATTIAKTVKKEESLEPKIKRERPPLYNLEFYLWKTVTPKEELKRSIEKLGGKVTSKVHSKLAAVISTPSEVERMGSKMLEIKELQIQVVPEDYVEMAKAGGAISYITSKAICDWGTDPAARIPTEEEYKSKSKSMYTKSVPKSKTLKVKGGIAVDPDSELDDIAHVYKKDKNEIFNVVLNNVNIQKDKNSYYKMQVLKSDKGERFWLFRSWGRIGTTIGGKNCDEMGGLREATVEFKRHFKDKTGNDWENRHNFVKIPDRYFIVDIDYGEEETKKLSDTHAVKSKLEKPVQDLVKMLFDVDTMKKVMLEFELDMEKMPLGKLSQSQLKSALSVLNEISNLIAKGGSNSEFIDASNRFYTLLPHDFGVERPPILDTVEVVQKKLEMLESLTEIELAYSLLNEQTDDKLNPLDAHFEQLKTEMSTLKKDSEEFKLLEQYVQNTHAATHNMYDLEIQEIFKIKRKNEDRRYKPFKKLHNRKLLWHGSRSTNFVGILSHGLKIAPPEAPVTGYMFGKGIYFADMVSKSANYCSTSKQNPVGLMLLCEVALGNMKEYKAAHYVEKLPKDKHSAKGIGKTYPDPTGSHVREDGVEIPMGKQITDSNVKTSLLYNEFIVYDIAQVNCQYLFKMKFNYKY